MALTSAQPRPQRQEQEREGEEEEQYEKHTMVLMTHLALKAVSILVYVFCEWFNSDFVLNFVVIVLLLAIDFWVCKNVSGRLLVGLRYWNEVDDTGESKWQFESRDEGGMRKIDPGEKRIFWLTLYVAPMIWLVFLSSSLMKLNFNYALVCAMAIAMLGTNLIGYIKCSKDQKDQISGYVRQGMISALTRGYL